MISISDILSVVEDQISDIIDKAAIQDKAVVAFDRVLKENGFTDSPYLKNYEITCESRNGLLELTLILDEQALSDESRRKMRKETPDKFKHESDLVRSKSDAKNFRYTYLKGPIGRPERIQGRRDARKPLKDGRRFQRDARKLDSDRRNTKEPKTSGERYVNHEFSATAPRDMGIDEEGKLRITLQREIRNTKKKAIFPQGEYQGIIKNLLQEITDIMEAEFGKALQRELDR